MGTNHQIIKEEIQGWILKGRGISEQPPGMFTCKQSPIFYQNSKCINRECRLNAGLHTQKIILSLPFRLYLEIPMSTIYMSSFIKCKKKKKILKKLFWVTVNKDFGSDLCSEYKARGLVVTADLQGGRG